MEQHKLDRRAARALVLFDAVIALTVSAIVLVLVLLEKNGGSPIVLPILMAVLIAVLAVGTKLLTNAFRGGVTRPVNELLKSMESTENGEAEDAVFILRTGDELEALSRALWSYRIKARSFDQKSSKLFTQQANSHAAADVLLRVRELLRAPVKPVFPGSENICLASSAESTGGQSGDFCDYFALPDGKLGFVAASISSWSMSEALYLLSVRAALRSAMTAEKDIEKALSGVSRNLFYLSEGEKFGLSVLAGELDTCSGELEYISAGYLPPFLLREGGLFEALPALPAQTPGSAEDLSFTAEKTTLGLGDRLVLCSGAAEENPDIGLSREKLIELLNAARTQPELSELLGSVSAGIRTVSAGMPLKSNLLMLALELKRNGRSSAALEVPADPRSFYMIRKLIDERAVMGVWPKKEYARLCVAAETLFGIVCSKTDESTVKVNCGARLGGKEVFLSLAAVLQHRDPLAEADDPQTQGAITFLRDSAKLSFSPDRDSDLLLMECSVTKKS